MTWDRIQRMQLEYQQLEARYRAEVETLSEQIDALREARAALVESRDLARRVAVALEQETARTLCAVCAGEIVAVEVRGEAR